MTTKEDHQTYANGLTLVRKRIALNSELVRNMNFSFTLMENRVAEAQSRDAFVHAIVDWSRLMRQALEG